MKLSLVPPTPNGKAKSLRQLSTFAKTNFQLLLFFNIKETKFSVESLTRPKLLPYNRTLTAQILPVPFPKGIFISPSTKDKMAGTMSKIVLFGAFTALVAVLIAWYMMESFNPESLRGKKVVICGASAGIGEELAYQYAKFGAQLLLVARRETELQKVVARCGELGAESASYVVADLSSLEGAKKLAAVSSKP